MYANAKRRQRDGCLVSSRYPPQVLNNQSDRSSIVISDGQKSVVFLQAVTRKVKAYFSTGWG